MSSRTNLSIRSPDFLWKVADSHVRQLEDELAVLRNRVRLTERELAKARARRDEAAQRFSRGGR